MFKPIEEKDATSKVKEIFDEILGQAERQIVVEMESKNE